MSGLGRTIKSLRVAAGIRQGTFAEQVGITQAYLSALEADKRSPSMDLVQKMAEALGIPPGALFSCMPGPTDLPSEYADIYTRLQGLQELLLKLLVVETAKRVSSSDEC